MTGPKGADERSAVQSIINGLPGAVFYLSSDEFEVEYISDDSRQFLPKRFKDRTLVGVRLVDFVTGGEKSPILPILRRVSETKEKLEIREFRAMNEDGNEFWVNWSAIPIENGTGRADLLVMIQDVTERKRAEEALSRQASLIDLTPDAIIVRGLDGTITFWSLGAEKLYGWAKEEAVGRTTHELLRTLFPEPLAEIVGKLKRDWSWSGDLIHRTKDGREVVVQSRWLVERDDKGAINYILESNVDITDRKKVEEALKESEEKFSRAFHGSSASTYITRLSDGKIIDANDRGLKILGYGRDELLGRTTIELNIWLTENDRQNVVNELKQKGSINNMELRLRKKNGQIWTALYSGQVIEFKGEEIMLSSLVDISERKKAEEALKESEAKYRGLFDNMQEAAAIWSYVLDEDGEIVDCRLQDANTEILKDRGVKELDQIRGKLQSELLPDDLDKSLDNVRWMKRTRSALVIERHLRYNDRYYRVSYIPLNQDRFAVTTLDITDIKRAHRQAEQERARLRTVLDTLPTGVVIADASGRMVEMNASFKQIWGTNAPLSDSVDQYFAYKGWRPDTDERYKAEDWSLARAVKNGESVIGEVIDIERFDGGRATILNSAAPIRDQDGRVLGAVVAAQDITELKKAEKELKESESRYRSLFWENSAPMLLINPSTGNIVDANQAACEYYGYRCEELQKMKISQINTLGPDEVKMEMSRSVGGEKRKFDFRHRLASGEVRDVDVYSGPVYLQGRQLLYSIVHDVTDRKRAENALKESEERFRTLADNIPQLAWMADATGWIFWYNRQWYDYTGTTPEQMEGWGWQSVHNPDVLPKVLDQWKSSIATGQPFDMVFPLRGADGVFRPFLTRVLPVKDESGKVARWFGTNTDITEEVETRRNLERSNAELQQFAYVASHDLQEPLRMIMNYLGLLNKKYGDEFNDQAKGYMAYVNAGAARMRELINDLLQYSRIDTAGQQFSAVDLNQVAEKVIDTLHVAINESKASITIEPLPRVWGDVTQLSLVLQNLVSNAVKFHGPEAPRIKIASRESAREWTISVQDNGIGIDPKYHDKLFQMFQRLHTREDYPGTGIGLAISKKVVERHGGRIWIGSDGRSGSTFFFTIPKSGERAR